MVVRAGLPPLRSAVGIVPSRKFNHLFLQSRENGIQLFPFDVGGGSGDDVAGG
jgi:hypothetical protein